MKKIFLGLLVLILMVGCGVGGYFISDQKVFEKKYSLSEAKDQIEQVCISAGWLGVEAKSTKLLNSNANTDNIVLADETEGNVHYEDYSEQEVNFNGKEDFVKAFTLVLREACAAKDIFANTYYTSKASYKIGGYTYNGEMNLYIKLGSDIAYFYVKDVVNNVSMVMTVTSKTNNLNNYQINGYINSTFGVQNGVTYYEIKADGNKITDFSYCEINTSINNFNLITAEDIYSIALYDCNVSTNKILNYNKSSLTDDEQVTFAKKVMQEFARIEIIDLTCKDFKEIEFLSKAYKDLGYETV